MKNSVSDAVNVPRTVRQERITGKIKHPYHINNDLCIKCGACKDNCNFDAIYVEA